MCLHIISDYCFVGLLGLLVVVYLLLVGTVAGLLGSCFCWALLLC